jgi:glutathione S-transferase
MIILHHLNNSRSQRILWLLEELGLDYDIKRYERDKITMLAPETLKKIHPLGKSPVITDGVNTIAESGAIVEYLLNTYGKGRLRPKTGTPEDLRFTFWLHYAEGSLMPPLLLKLIFSKIESGPMPFFVKPIAKAISKKVHEAFITPQLRLHFGYLEHELEAHTWFTGEEFTAADIQLSFPIEAAKARKIFDTPKLNAYLEKIHSRPAYKKALERGGEYEILN